ncbi:MAG: lysophospholipase [Treponema sp.]|jgi:alpha-beta hydrolase superfamily lysophospholipase|nr:lysophospholipase [Treponema sp.]
MDGVNLSEKLDTLSTPDTWLSAYDGAKLFVRHWIPYRFLQRNPLPRGVLHIVHGMGEHSLRYERLAKRLSEEGIEVWAADQRGHGKTADLSINPPGKGGLLGHCADTEGIPKLIGDIDCINQRIKQIYPQVPLFLLGHSWGSFLVQQYLETHAYGLAGCILSGTRGPDGLRIRMSAPFMALLTLLKGGPRKISVLARMAADGPFNKPFKPNRTAFDWLSRDEAMVDAYVADPLSGLLCSVGFYRDLSILLNQIHKPEALERIRRDIPIYVFCGSADPVGEMGKSPTALVNAYRSLGIEDLEFVLYPDARHETLHETNREEVTDNLLSWIIRHCDSPVPLEESRSGHGLEPA